MNELVMPGLLISCVQTQAKSMSCGLLFFSRIYNLHTSANFQAALQTLSALIQMRLDIEQSRAVAITMKPEQASLSQPGRFPAGMAVSDFLR